MWFNILYCIAIILVLTLQCVGKKGVSAGKTCVDSFALFIASSVTNVITDVIMLIIPLFAIWNLHMATQRKVGIAAIFAVGTAYVFFNLFSPHIPLSFFFFPFPGPIGLWNGDSGDLGGPQPQYTKTG